MNAPTPTGPAPHGPGLHHPGFGRPSPALLARADHGYTRFLTAHAPDTDPGTHNQDDAAVHR
ncbi:hypothetical protein ACFC34_37390 [Streptomyces sp. NPDC056053]|uniref:hypothetical protein n=1 Tax=Streptomyces sp. NPDC056053 TaxID=3345696 RepID=UPI0035DAB5C3